MSKVDPKFTLRAVKATNYISKRCQVSLEVAAEVFSELLGILNDHPDAGHVDEGKQGKIN
jgi:hypothetical protein